MTSTGKSTDEVEVDALASAFFALFSNRDGVPDLTRIHELFVPAGTIARCTQLEPEVTTPAEFIVPRQELLSNGTLTGFAEWETAASTQIRGNIAQRLSIYEKRGARDGVPFEQRGAKMFQFVRTAAGWKILSVAWDDERESFTLPAFPGVEQEENR
jgi:hypothetical protein